MILRAHAEQQFAEELAVLRQHDTGKRPTNWLLSPQAVLLYLMGGQLANGFVVSPKYIGNKRLMEIAVATLTTDRALLLYGLPGTAKSWVSEHLAAAISGLSTLMVQGTAGANEEQIRYGWNYARLLAEGPSERALVASPVLRAMSEGRLARIEELTRMPADVQDSLITVLSEKTLPIPELGTEVQAIEGFNVIATANNRDKGVHELSAALKRRFNTVILPTPESVEVEVTIVQNRLQALNPALEVVKNPPLLRQIQRVVTIFRELRQGLTTDGRTKVKTPTGSMSTAEAISVMNNSVALALHFGNGQPNAGDVAASISGAVLKDPIQDRLVWQEYTETVLKNRDDWADMYHACREML